MHRIYIFIETSISDLFKTEMETVSIPAQEMSFATEKWLKKSTYWVCVCEREETKCKNLGHSL
jgi:hypothetical protein